MKHFASEKPLEEFYLALASGDSDTLRRVHIPRSDVFYVRQKIYLDTGEWYSLDRVERAMLLEGMLSPEDCLDPSRVRRFEDGQSY